MSTALFKSTVTFVINLMSQASNGTCAHQPCVRVSLNPTKGRAAAARQLETGASIRPGLARRRALPRGRQGMRLPFFQA